MILSEGRHNSAFWRRTVPKILLYDFLLPDIVILEIIFYRGTYDLDELTRKLLSELSLYVH